MLTLPLTPVSPPFADPTDTAPDAALDELPLVSVVDPPTAPAEELPPFRTIDPPALDTDEPPFTFTSPPAPAMDAPTDNAIDPVLPRVAVPVLRCSAPLDASPNVADEAISMDPLDPSSLRPLAILTLPPASPSSELATPPVQDNGSSDATLTLAHAQCDCAARTAHCVAGAD